MSENAETDVLTCLLRNVPFPDLCEYASVIMSMFADSANRPMSDQNPLATYARSLHDYTLRLWTESRRVAEEKAMQKAALRQQEEERMAAMKAETKAYPQHA